MSNTRGERKKTTFWVLDQADLSATRYVGSYRIKAYMNNSSPTAAIGVAIVQRYVAAFCGAWEALEAGKGVGEAKEEVLGAKWEPPKNSPPLDEAVVKALLHVAVYEADALWHRT